MYIQLQNDKMKMYRSTEYYRSKHAMKSIHKNTYSYVISNNDPLNESNYRVESLKKDLVVFEIWYF